MIEIEIPKDIRQYDAKLIGPFNVRQTACFVSGAIITVPVYFAIRDLIPTDISLFIAICIYLPFLLCGWIKVYGLPFERFFLTFVYSTLLAPANRKYKTKNIFDIKENKFEETDLNNEHKVKKKKKKNKIKDPELKAYK